FQHVRIIPVSRSSIRLKPDLLIENCHYSVRATSTVGPLLFSTPPVVDVASRPPQISPDLCAPKPRFGSSPLANAEHNRPSAGIKCIADVCVRSFRILRRC